MEDEGGGRVPPLRGCCAQAQGCSTWASILWGLELCKASSNHLSQLSGMRRPPSAWVRSEGAGRGGWACALEPGDREERLVAHRISLDGAAEIMAPGIRVHLSGLFPQSNWKRGIAT